MAAITASMVAELRARTDAPMMECKKALTEADGDLTRAEEILRVKLGNKAGKAASRITAEGVVASVVKGSTGALIEVNCETDFVSKNDAFLAFVNAVAGLVADSNPADVAALSALPLSQEGFGPTVEDVRAGLIGKIGENMTIRRFKRYEGAQAGLVPARHPHRRDRRVRRRRSRRQGRRHARRRDEAGRAVVGRSAGRAGREGTQGRRPRRLPNPASRPRSSPRWSKARCRSS